MLEFWFDFASSYSYIAAQRVEALCGRAGLELRWRPFLLGPLFTAQLGIKDSPFNVNPARGQYMWKDVERQCRKYGLPFARPSLFPQRSVLAARVACAALESAWCGDFIRATFRANFAEGRDIGAEAVVGDLITSVGGDAGDALARAHSDTVKAQLRQFTDEAGRRGLFGAPSVITRGELFFGQDRLDDAIAHATGG